MSKDGINPNIRRKKRQKKDVRSYIEGLISGDRFVLSEVLTLAESNDASDRKIASAILEQVPINKNCIRIGVTGSPGAGKSTMIEALGLHLVGQGKKVAVLAVDPSSTISSGSILGDKTRMQELSRNEWAYIRPTAASNVLGGVARRTKESIALCEAAGYDVIIIESVGVGQSETSLAQLTDLYMVLLLPGAGDEVQGIKRGIIEWADLLIINKNDGDRKALAESSRKAFANANRLFHHPMKDWKVPVLLGSALEKSGIENIWANIQQFVQKGKSNGFFERKRADQSWSWLKSQIEEDIYAKANVLFEKDPLLKSAKKDFSEEQVFKLLHIMKHQLDEKFKTLL